MMPGVPQPANNPTPPPDRITLWQGEDGRWLALITYGNLQTCLIRPTRDQARADCLAFWREHTREGKEACR